MEIQPQVLQTQVLPEVMVEQEQLIQYQEHQLGMLVVVVEVVILLLVEQVLMEEDKVMRVQVLQGLLTQVVVVEQVVLVLHLQVVVLVVIAH